jgi:pyrimidine-nucleoside phosphorylase
VEALEIISRKRDGGEHSAAEIAFLLDAYLTGKVPDYQMAAWLMAVCIRGMTRGETLTLTQAMVASGEVLDLSSIPGIKVDKHSTGGVGDKVTLIAAPLAAACGVVVPKLSGRALAHTGGTLDKLESVPGVTVDLEPERFLSQLREIGIAIAAQSARMVPADRAIYALRDATATVPSIPLIAASVMSKKIAAGANAIVLDVKAGRGAFMADTDQAVALASEMVLIGEGAGRQTVALVTAMDSPLGRCIGNALEVEEALAALSGGADEELRSVSVAVAREMCKLAGVTLDPAEALASGAGRNRFEQMLRAQGGRLEEALPRAAAQASLRADSDGWVSGIDALEVGLACVEIGVGRSRKDDVIDPGAGVVIAAPVGSEVRRGDVMAVVHARNTALCEGGVARLRTAWRVSSEPAPRPPHILYRVDRSGARPTVLG